MDELSCVPETQQSQQAAGVEDLVVGVEEPLEMSDTEQGDTGRHSRIWSQVMWIHRTHRVLAGHRRARAKARARLTKGAAHCSVQC